MGEGWTPLVGESFRGMSVLWKLEFVSPTGSYKDRGIAPLFTLLKEAGVRAVVEDSSGNAGASVAAYAARAEIPASIYVPAHASPAKLRQIAAYGAQVVPIAGPRANATRAALAALDEHIAYASHVWQPAVLSGLRTFAWETWEQMGRQAPDWLVAPVGQGTLLLGAYQGFVALQSAGLIERVPRLVAVQAAHCAPLYSAWERHADGVDSVAGERSVAEGISISSPVHGARLLAAIRHSGGLVLTVSEEEILSAQENLTRRGLYIEPTAAAAPAALPRLAKHVRDDQSVLVPLTGSGLKQAA
jgi:threonine synthase